ncbi:hypothetical protein [Agromyces atrinae]|uniref:Uncharacterized protein n=1 Tax=Agromyces atrinae TaxID=592376 RepID=A0A4Q2MCH1_9MICO|nr:hypothetical protein [Agromyces atrinae]NYD67597.1 hypothetical protein [Agromyces atrinae]RXZ88193.1 hypothetical protein ESP50_03160 [Agromyces atrinae]
MNNPHASSVIWFDGGMTTASELWIAEIELVPLSPLKAVVRTVATVGALAASFVGLGGESWGPGTADLVIRRISDGHVMYRASQNDGDTAEALLGLAIEELETLSPEQFADEWGFERDQPHVH